MKFMSRTLLPVVALAASVSLAQAQTQPDHQAHHVAGQGATQAAPTASSDQSHGSMQGMTGPGDTMRMMPMMQGMMGQRNAQSDTDAMSCPMMATGGMGSMGSMGMPFEHVEGRIAFLKAELGITDAQTKEWKAFADALRTNAEVHRSMHGQMMKGETSASLTERLAQRERALSVRLEATKRLNAAATPLFAALSEEQRKAAEDLLGGSLGMM
ncbi:Spy/CpxP family protein refolding chaperone [Azospirillum sp. BE72]|uniref:Spy/CpxP family protein refolding chaperone n=1 Tax=Azospirillum sp. BE72 TaxID=2817776 RepID=UPI00285F3F72|nr:Spy/CpxP family protein refolding chaperone [Azospirillum sp. BE72]MDR6775612.1 hypothetical protein [Azospirillum sp. BE72]